MSTELSPMTRALLRTAREDGPSTTARARILGGVAAATSGATALGVTAKAAAGIEAALLRARSSAAASRVGVAALAIGFRTPRAPFAPDPSSAMRRRSRLTPAAPAYGRGLVAADPGSASPGDSRDQARGRAKPGRPDGDARHADPRRPPSSARRAAHWSAASRRRPSAPLRATELLPSGPWSPRSCPWRRARSGPSGASPRPTCGASTACEVSRQRARPLSARNYYRSSAVRGCTPGARSFPKCTPDARSATAQRSCSRARTMASSIIVLPLGRVLPSAAAVDVESWWSGSKYRNSFPGFTPAPCRRSRPSRGRSTRTSARRACRRRRARRRRTSAC